MLKKFNLLFLLGCFCLTFTQVLNAQSNGNKGIQPEKRDPLKQPFSSNSIWNMPIGSKAQYVHAGIQRAMSKGMTIDEDLIVLTPNAPKTEIYKNFAGWDRDKNRCEKEGDVLFSAPIPDDFVVSPDTWDGTTPNSGLAILLEDGRTIRQTQPFSRCNAGSYATSQYVFGDQDIYDEGYYGAHGGSGLSAIGGALRVGELTPGSGPISHVLKVNLFGKRNFYYDDQTKGFVWPARRADGYASSNYGKERNVAFVNECRMGALLALPPFINLDSLKFETLPGRMLAEAFRDYGAYIVDDTAWDVYALVTEWGPNGRVGNEFEKAWGFPIDETGKDTPWGRDMDRLFLNLHVVVNNSSQTIGGGGEPVVPMAAPLSK